jgi:hypothetical protein
MYRQTCTSLLQSNYYDLAPTPPPTSAVTATMHDSSRRGIILYLEYLNVCPFVRIGSPASSPTSECAPPRNQKRGNTGLAGEGSGGASSDDWRGSLALCLLCGSPPSHTLTFLLNVHCTLSKCSPRK